MKKIGMIMLVAMATAVLTLGCGERAPSEPAEEKPAVEKPAEEKKAETEGAGSSEAETGSESAAE